MSLPEQVAKSANRNQKKRTVTHPHPSASVLAKIKCSYLHIKVICLSGSTPHCAILLYDNCISKTNFLSFSNRRTHLSRYKRPKTSALLFVFVRRMYVSRGNMKIFPTPPSRLFRTQSKFWACTNGFAFRVFVSWSVARGRQSSYAFYFGAPNLFLAMGLS